MPEAVVHPMLWEECIKHHAFDVCFLIAIHICRVKRGKLGYNFSVATKILHFVKSIKCTRTIFSKKSEKTLFFDIVHNHLETTETGRAWQLD